MSVVTEIENLIEVIASRLPASMEKPTNKKIEKQFRTSMSNYFQSLADSFPYDRLTELYLDNVKEAASPSGDWDDLLDSLLGSFDFQFSQSVTGHMANIYVSGSNQMVSYGKTKMGIPIAYEGPPVSKAIEWAQEYSAQLVTKIDQETKKRLAQVISDGIKNKRGIDGLSRDIRKEFSDMSRARATTIAQTETNEALSQASLDRMQDMGVDGKEAVVIGDERTCPICNGNAAQGVIPVKQPFQSGHMRTPFHVNCRCCTAPARLDRAIRNETNIKSFDANSRKYWLESLFSNVNLEERHLDAVHSYTHLPSINQAIREGRMTSPKDKQFISNLDDAIEHFSIPENVEVWRGIGKGAFPEKDMTGRIFSERSYVSTSFNVKIAERFAIMRGGKRSQTLMQITITKGTKALPVEFTGEGLKNQSEMILGRNTRFRVISDTKEGNRRIIKAEVLHGKK